MPIITVSAIITIPMFIVFGLSRNQGWIKEDLVLMNLMEILFMKAMVVVNYVSIAGYRFK